MISPTQQITPVNASSSLTLCNQKLLAKRFNVCNNAKVLSSMLHEVWPDLYFRAIEVVPDKAATYYVIVVSHECRQLGYYQSK